MDYSNRMEHLRRCKQQQTNEKLRVQGFRNEDDYGLVLPPEDFKVELPVRDADGSFSGVRAWGKNFRWLMENHPCWIDANDALAGRWMFMLSRMRLGYKLELANFVGKTGDANTLRVTFRVTDGSPYAVAVTQIGK